MAMVSQRIVMVPISAVVDRGGSIFRDSDGFSLIELLIALSIIAVVAAMVMPSYSEQLIQVRRSDGTTALTTFSQRVERHFLENGSYSSATTDLYKALSESGHYTLSITTTASSYALTATPTSSHSGDSLCGTLTLNNLGVRGSGGSGAVTECW